MEGEEKPERTVRVIESEEYKKAKSEGTPPPETKVDPAPETTPIVVPPIEDYVQILSKETGFEFKTKDDIVSGLKARTALEQELSTEKAKWTELDPLVLDLNKAIRSGMDTETYLEARKLDDEKISKLNDKEAIRKWTFLSESKLVAQDQQFAEMKFERDHKAKFGIITAELTLEEQTEDAKRDKEFAERQLKVEGTQAREKLKEWRTQNITIPEPKVEQKRDEQAIYQAYEQQIETYLGAFKSIDIPVDDKVYKHGIEDLTEIKTTLKDPLGFLLSNGIDVIKGEFDGAKLAALVTREQAWKNIGKPLKTWALEQFNAETVKSKLNQPAPPQNTAVGDVPEKTQEQKVGEAFAAERQRKREQQQ